MNIKTTLVLLVIAAVLLGVWAGFFRDGPGKVAPWTGQPFFGSFIPSDAAEIRIEDGSGERVEQPLHFARTPLGWEVSSSAVEEGHAVRARTQVVAEILDAVQAIVPLRVVQEAPSGQEELDLGLDVRRRLTVAVSGPHMEPISLHFGSKVGAGEVTCRSSARSEIFAVPHEALRRLTPRPTEAIDPAVLRLDVLNVRQIKVEREGERALDIARSHSRWFLNAPFEAAPGDGQRCDQLRSAVLGLGIVKRLWKKKIGDVIPTPPPWRITVGTTTGASRVIELGERVGQGLIAAHVVGTEHAVVVSDDILALFDGDWGRFRDRHPIDAPASRLVALALHHKDRPPVAFRRYNATVFKIDLLGRENPSVPMLTDDVEMSSFLSALRGIELIRFGGKDLRFEPDLKIVITLHEPGATESIERTVEIGPVTDGMRALRLVGQPGIGWINAESTGFLMRPYWELRERKVWCADAYFKLGRLQIRDSKGNVANYVGRIPAPKADLILSRDRNGNLTDIPKPIKDRVVRHMIGETFSAHSWIGETATDAMGFDTPHLLVRWFEPKDATVEGIPPGDSGTWKALVIGSRRADGLHYARIEDGTLASMFLLSPKDLAPFFDILK